MLLPELQNCLALVAEVTAEAWLLSSDFRTAVPSLFFSSPQKHHILALSLLEVSSSAARMSPLLSLGIYSLLGIQKAECSHVNSIRAMILSIPNL